jgi:hypothetical protein
MASQPPNSAPQDHPPGAPERRTLFLALYALLTLGVLLASGFLATRVAAPAGPLATGESTGTATQEISGAAPSSTASSTSTLTATSTGTARATFTPRPSSTSTITLTPTATATRTLAASLTPAVPIESNEPYLLIPWTPELADRLIEVWEAYPETLSTFARGEDGSGYFSAFEYAVLAQREALLRFPTAPQAQDWLWDLAYNLARLGDPAAGSTYAALITQELNAGRVQLASLFDWGNFQDPPVAIETFNLETPPGLLSSNLIKVSAGESGSAFFWLLERPNGFESFPLTSDFDFVHPSTTSHFVSDLTGDGSPEVAIFRTRVPNSNRAAPPRLFDLNQQPPVELSFEAANPPEIGPDFDNHWEPAAAGEGDLQFADAIFPPCPVTIRHLYDWNGRGFEFREARYEVDPSPELLSYCSLVVEHAASVWDVATTVRIMETLLQSWPPETDLNGAPYPPDALDEWRYRLGLYQALLGNDNQARGYAEAVLANPAGPAGRWTTLAEEFLAGYQTPRDIYRVCLLSDFCNPRLAFQRLVETLSREEYPLAPQILADAGVMIRAAGFFDFDNDGETERWLLVRHQPGSAVELWILAPFESGLRALFVTPMDSDQARFSFVEPVDDPPVVSISPELYLRYTKTGAAGEPVAQIVTPEITFSADVTQQRLAEIQSALFAGGDPAQLQEQLVALEQEPFFTCSYQLCPRYWYLLGLASELAGDETSAIAAYLQLWRDYLGHPFVSLARLRLAGPALRPGPTATLTRTPFPTRAASTPFRTSTPTSTSTSSGGAAGQPAPTPSPSSTTESYPAPP